MNAFPRPFVLRRTEDVSGVSGTGDVASGVVFDDGTVAIRWRSGTASTVLWASLDDAMAVHGHDGRTRAVFEKEEVEDVDVMLRRDLRSAEEELKGLRPEVVALREQCAKLTAELGLAHAELEGDFVGSYESHGFGVNGSRD